MAAQGLVPADIVVCNSLVFNPFTCTWDAVDFAIKKGIIIGAGSYTGNKELDLRWCTGDPRAYRLPCPYRKFCSCTREFARLVARHGTTTVIADPHEIANVLGKDG